jgi:hypothetical protein
MARARVAGANEAGRYYRCAIILVRVRSPRHQWKYAYAKNQRRTQGHPGGKRRHNRVLLPKARDDRPGSERIVYSETWKIMGCGVGYYR